MTALDGWTFHKGRRGVRAECGRTCVYICSEGDALTVWVPRDEPASGQRAGTDIPLEVVRHVLAGTMPRESA
jgi:hypothetical protein